MPRATTSRSQKATQSHSQAKPTQNHADADGEEDTEDEEMQPEVTQGNSGGDVCILFVYDPCTSPEYPNVLGI
jgi:hypothetical protein